MTMSTRKRTTTGSGFLGTPEESFPQEEKITEEILSTKEVDMEEKTAPDVEETVKPEITVDPPKPPKLEEKPKPKQPEVAPKPVVPHINPKPNRPVEDIAPRRNIPRFVR